MSPERGCRKEGGVRREEKSKAMLRIQHYREILFEGTGSKDQKVTPMFLGIWGHRVKVAAPHHHVQRLRMLLGALQPCGMGGGGSPEAHHTWPCN